MAIRLFRKNVRRTNPDSKVKEVIDLITKKHLGSAKILASFLGHRYAAFTKDYLLIVKSRREIDLDKIHLEDGKIEEFINKKVPITAIVGIKKINMSETNVYAIKSEFNKVKDQPADMLIEENGKTLTVNVISSSNAKEIRDFIDKLCEIAKIEISSS